MTARSPSVAQLSVEADGREQMCHVASLEVRAEEPVHTVRADPNRSAVGQLAPRIGTSGLELRASWSEQLGEAAHGQLDALRVAPLLETDRRFRAQAESAGRLGDRDGQEPGHLQEHIGGAGVDLRGGTTHHSGDADGDVEGVADQQIVTGEGSLDVVERDERLAGAGAADAKARTGHALEVVGVVGLTQLEHHVVGHVDHVVDRSHAEQREARRQLGIGRADRDAAQDAGREAAAQIGIEDLDADVGCLTCRTLLDNRIRQREGHAEPGGEVTCHACDRHGIGPIGIDLQLVADIRRVDAHRLGQGLCQV